MAPRLRSAPFFFALALVAGAPQMALAAEPEQDTQKLHAAGWTGVGLGVAGLATGITGGVLLPQTRERRAFGTGEFEGTLVIVTERRHPLSTTVPLITIGAVSLLSGVGLLAWDLSRSKRQRKMSLAPSFGTSFTGLSASGRF